MSRKKRLTLEIIGAVLVAIVITVLNPPKAEISAQYKNYTYENQYFVELTGENLELVRSIFDSSYLKADQTVGEEVVFTYDFGIMYNNILFLLAFDGSPYLQASDTGKIYQMTSEQRAALDSMFKALHKDLKE